MTASAADIIFTKTSEGTSSGGVNSGVPISSTRNSFMPAITDSERLVGGSRIKKFCVFNNHATDDYTLPGVWVNAATGITDEIGLGLDDGDDDDTTQGNGSEFSGSAVVAVISDGSDTRDVTVVGLDGSGDPQTEVITLNGTSEVLGALTFSAVYGASVSATDGSRTVLVKQGTGGTTRFTIGPTFKASWVWLAANSQGAAIMLANLVAQTAYCFYWRQTWAAAVAGQRPDTSTLFAVDN
jgi:hypothetical protein